MRDTLLGASNDATEEQENTSSDAVEQDAAAGESTDTDSDSPSGVDSSAVFEKMVPLFKQLNLEQDQARELLDRMISGKDIGDLADNQGLIFGKYKDAVAAQEAFKKLESENGRLRREKAPKAPEKYEYNFSDDADLSNIIPDDYAWEDDPLVQHMEPVFKEGNFTQDQVALATKAWLKYQASSQPNPKEEKAKLGEAANDLLDGATAFRDSAEFNEEEKAIIESWTGTAEEVRLVNKIRKMTAGTKTIPTQASTTTAKSSAELYSEAKAIRAKPNFALDTDAQKMYEAKMDLAIAAEEKGY